MKLRVLKSNKDIIFFVLVVGVLYTIVAGVFMNRTFSWHTYAGIGGVGLCCIMYFINYKIFNYIFILTLILGLFNVFHFTYNIITVSLYFEVLKFVNIETLEIQLLSLVLIILYGYFYRKQLLNLIRSLILKSEEERQEELESQIAMFERKFKDIPKEELIEMKKNKENYSDIALIAVKRSLKK